MAPISKRYDVVFYFDVLDGNPNGDPDAGNLPRIDPETGHGLVTDVALKRKVRNYVAMTKSYVRPYDIFVKEKAILNKLIEEAHEQPEVSQEKEKAKTDKARDWMCRNYYDIRTFGAVMSTGEKNAGQVRGPVQWTFARSVEPIVTLEHTITRMAVTTEREAQEQGGDNRTMGRKYTVPYGLYRSHIFISPFLAQQTGFSEEDLQLLWDALMQMFEHDHSAARGLMSTRAIIAFEHPSPLGSKPAYELFQRVTHRRTTSDGPARSFDDYQILLDGQPIQQTFMIVPVS
jgi:CRISPR-associated protein Csd2